MLGSEKLKPITWSVWAGNIEEKGGHDNPFRAYEDGLGFWDVRVCPFLSFPFLALFVFLLLLGIITRIFESGLDFRLSISILTNIACMHACQSCLQTLFFSGLLCNSMHFFGQLRYNLSCIKTNET